MSYSFSVIAADKAKAKAEVAVKMATVALSQPVHANDLAAAVTAAGVFVDLLGEQPEGQVVHVNVHGSLGWNNDAPDAFTSTGFGVNASFRLPPTED